VYDDEQPWLHSAWQRTETPPRAGQWVPAAFGIRLLAYALDVFFLGLLLAAAALPFYLLDVNEDGTGSVWTSLVLALAVGYSPVLTAVWGATPGKRLCGLRVMRLLTGQPASFGRILFRHVLHAFMVIPLLFLLTHLWPLWDKPYRQTLHDKWAHTVVVRQHQ
jgi:uncharacterized RDD family membrane protein YckC